jgi:cardiolipin synthase A/B
MTGMETGVEWLGDGDQAFRALFDTIASARRSLRLETYILSESAPGDAVREALGAAARRGVDVRLMVDGIGSIELPDRALEETVAAGVVCRVFNPVSKGRLLVRNHRKLVVADDRVALVGGFNVAPEYLGDGVTRGWCDVGIRLEGPAVPALASGFDHLWSLAETCPARFVRLRRRDRTSPQTGDPSMSVLESGPGRGRALFLGALHKDLETAWDIEFAVAYFLPGLRLRRLMARRARAGARVRLLVPGRTDVPMSRRAARFLYGGLLRAGVEILEYRPQVLHAKLYRLDDIVYVGSSNLDTRSLHLNHEIMVRIQRPEVAEQARAWMSEACGRADRVEARTWNRSRGRWERLREAWAHFVLARLDPYLTRRLAPDPR